MQAEFLIDDESVPVVPGPHPRFCCLQIPRFGSGTDHIQRCAMMGSILSKLYCPIGKNEGRMSKLYFPYWVPPAKSLFNSTMMGVPPRTLGHMHAGDICDYCSTAAFSGLPFTFTLQILVWYNTRMTELVRCHDTMHTTCTMLYPVIAGQIFAWLCVPHYTYMCMHEYFTT